MASELDTLVSTGATLAVGSNIMFDSVTVGASTGKVEVVKIGDGTAGSTTLVPMSSNGIGAAGLNVFNTNSSANPSGVTIVNGQSTVTGSGVFHIDDNAGSVTVDFSNSNSSVNAIVSSASIIRAKLAAGQSSVSVASLPNLSTGSIVRVDTIAAFPANSSLVVINAAVPQSSVTISAAGLGGASGSPLFVSVIPQTGGVNSTFANPAKLTSTALTALFSSGASTRWNMTDITITNKGATATLVRVFDGASNATILYQAWCASAGGGVAPTFPIPRIGSSGVAVNVKQLPASTVYVSAGGFRSA